MKFVKYMLIVIFLKGIISAQHPSKIWHLDPYNPEYAPKTILVKFKDESNLNKSLAKTSAKTGISAIDKLNQKYEVTSMEKVFQNAQPALQKKIFQDYSGNTHQVPNLDKIYKMKYEANFDPKEIIKDYQEKESIEYAEPDYYVYSMATEPDDPFYQSGDQWYLDEVNAPAAWDSTTGDTSQVIGILDTGVDWDHPDLDDNIWWNWDEIPDNGVDDDGNGYVDDVRGWDYINNDNDPDDDNSHGTHVAGIAAAEGNNGIGITGVAYNSRIMPLKVLQSSGSGNSSDLATAIDYAANNGATVINMSLGSYGESLTVKEALYNAYVKSLLVAAAGNDGLPLIQEGIPSGNMYPACYPFILGVQAKSSFTNYDPSGPIDYWNEWGNNYELKAPGTAIYSTFPSGNYNSLNGTSMSAPVVSGICALHQSYNQVSADTLWAKLIFGSENEIVNAYNTLTFDLNEKGPDLRFIEYTLIDTLPGCDEDGRPDAGETVELYFTVMNVGGQADSVWSKLRFQAYEDTTVAIITDSTSYIGNISTWSTMTGEFDPIIIDIAKDVANNRDICFEYEIGCKNGNKTLSDTIIIKNEKGEELSGVMDSTLILSSDKLWLINNSFRIGTNGTLKIEPGTQINISKGFPINNKGTIQATGTKDRIIKINGPGSINGSGTADFNYTKFEYINGSFGEYGANMSFDHCAFNEINSLNTGFSDGYGLFLCSNLSITNSHLKNCYIHTVWTSFSIKNLEIKNNIFNNFYLICNLDMTTMDLDLTDIEHNVFSNFMDYYTEVYGSNSSYSKFIYDLNDRFGNIRNNSFINFDDHCYVVKSQTDKDIVSVGSNYWGATNTDIIDGDIYDFWDNSSLPQLNYEPILTRPSNKCPGHVWKVQIDGADPRDDNFAPVGIGKYKFDVYFNRAMDTSYTPLVGFGVDEPYLQRIVDKNSFWSEDSSIWTAYYDIGPETGDGIQTIHVRNAYDDEGFEIPPEKTRFQFEIQAAGAASVEFLATPGIGKVNLEWPPASTEDALGYNLYRSIKTTDSTWSDSTMINDQLITDTTFTDFEVIPDTTYKYIYTVVGTDMQETDPSKKITARPFSAANGDANGDMSVDVLDIISVVSYMLQEDPQPFLFDAADLNGDDVINILDIISIVNEIQNSTGKIVASHDTKSMFTIDNDQINLSSDGAIAGYEFKLVGDIGDLSLSSEVPFELGSLKISEDTLQVVAYSLKGNILQAGNHSVLKLNNSNNLRMTDLLVSGPNGQQVQSRVGDPGQKLVPEKFALHQNYPNPFNARTIIKYNLPEVSDVKINIYNLLGQRVFSKSFNDKEPGYYQFYWNGRDKAGKQMSSGLYLYRIRAGNFIDTKKMILLK